MSVDRYRSVALERLARGFLGRLARHAVLRQPYIYGPRDRVRVGRGVVLNNALLNTVSGSICIEDGVFLGHNVSLLTGSHDFGPEGPRKDASPADGHDIVVERGAWVASSAVVLGPCRIGAGAVVAAGAIVTKDVPARSIVAGVSARQVGTTS